MSKSKAYRATDVKDVRIESVIRLASGRKAVVGVDIGKFEMFAVIRWNDGPLAGLHCWATLHIRCIRVGPMVAPRPSLTHERWLIS